jgi:hypothetical protein
VVESEVAVEGGSGVVGCCVTVKESGTTWCVRMSKHMQMVCAHLGIFKLLTFQLFQLGYAPHIVVRCKPGPAHNNITVSYSPFPCNHHFI